MPVYWSKAEARWRFEFDRRIEGRRHRLTKLLPKGWSRAQADQYDRTESARLYAHAAGLSQDRLPLAGAVQLYLDHRIPKLKNGKKAAQDLAHLFAQIESHYLDEASDLATRYELEHPELAPATVHNRLAYLRAAVRYAYRKHRYGDRDYTDRMTLPAPDNARQVYARLPELNRLWKAFEDDEARAIFRLTFYLGLRWRAELLRRMPEDVVRNGRDVWLKIGKTKNGQDVMKPVHAAAVADLEHLPFTHADGWFYRRWKKAVATMGRPELRPHDLRHSLASEVISRPGATLDDVRAALHHQSVQAADRYAHLYPERTRAILMATGRGAKRKRRGAGGG